MNARYFLISAVLLAFLITPAIAGMEYVSQGPSFSAAITGTNEFSPGLDVSIIVKLENRGLMNIKFSRSGYIDRDDLPNTAKFVTVTMRSGDSPLIIKSDPQMAGDIPGGNSVQIPYIVKIPKEAPSGNYTLPLEVKYMYLASAEQNGQDTLQYTYKEKTDTIPIPLTINSKVFIAARPVGTETLNVGTEGFLDLNVSNTGTEDATNTVIKIVRNGNSPVTPTDSSVYIGEFPAGSSSICRFKVALSLDAESQEYPLDVYAVYKDHNGDTITSGTTTVGVPVHGKIKFNVVSAKSDINPGSRKIIEVEYRNTGAATAYNSQARISAVDPFTSRDDTAYLGDIAPGASAVARYEVSVDSGAVVKGYALDSEVRYRDSLDNSQISDTMKVPVQVVSPTFTGTIVSNIPIVVIVIGVVIVAGYYLIVVRKKN
jgi:hypothetical protein